MKQSKKERGFSLLELILGIAILGIVVAPLLGFFTNSMMYHSQSDDRQLATILAQQKMEELKTLDFTELEDRKETDAEITGYPGFTRTVEINDTLDNDPDLRVIKITVEWDLGDGQVILTTIVARRR